MPRTEDLPNVTGPGVGKQRIKSIDNAVSNWRDLVTERMAILEKEVEARGKVLDLMHKNGLSRYQYDDDHVVELIPGQEKVKVKPVASESETDVNED